METAILKAKEGGYSIWGGPVKEEEYDTLLLDPLFWQCLGKQQGWLEVGELWYDIHDKEQCENPQYDHSRTWLGKWHSFIDHIADGGTPDEFFNNLLK